MRPITTSATTTTTARRSGEYSGDGKQPEGLDDSFNDVNNSDADTSEKRPYDASESSRYVGGHFTSLKSPKYHI